MIAHELGDGPVLPPEFWDDPAVAAALAHHDPSALIRLVRELTPLSQDHIARLTGLSQAMVSQVASGARSVRNPAKRNQVFTGLGAPPAPKLDPNPAAHTSGKTEADPLAGYTVRAIIADDAHGRTVVLHWPDRTTRRAIAALGPPAVTRLSPPPDHPHWPPPA